MEESLHERADAYLSNRLTPEEKIAFELEVMDNEALAIETAKLKEEKAAIREAVKDQLKNQANDFLAEHQQNRFILRRIGYAVAAAFVILLLSIPFWSSFQAVNATDLYAEAFSLPTKPSLRDANSETSAIWQSAIEAYQAAQYEQAIAQFSACLTQADFSFIGDAYFYRAISHMQLQHPQAAIADLKAVPSVHILFYEAQWYRALAHLQADQIDLAKGILSEIAVDTTHYAQTEAIHLLEQLNKIEH
ncbi:MAG: hypothetical protein AAFN10_01880 [Bacteroidota bacterium]